MKLETYKEVKIFDWKNYSAKQRDSAAKNARAAFDKLGLSSDAPERSILDPDQVKRSPPLVAEGYIGNMDTTQSRWRSGGGGGGSESEGLENGRTSTYNNSLLKPPSASSQKKVSARKSPATSASSTLPSKKKSTSSSSATSKSTSGGAASSSGTKSNRQTAAAAASILDAVPNHSVRAQSSSTTPSTTTKPTLSGVPSALSAVGSPNLTGRRGSITSNGNGTAMARRGSETKKSGNRDSGGGLGNGYKIPKMVSRSTIPRRPLGPCKCKGHFFKRLTVSIGPKSQKLSLITRSKTIAFTVPPITTQAEYTAVSHQFHSKYKEMKILKTQIDRKKEEFDRLNGELELAMGSEHDRNLKRRVEQAFGQEVPDRKLLRRTGEPRTGVSAEKAAAVIAEQQHRLSVRTLVERYKILHNEVDTIKKALWEAGTAQAEKVASLSGPILSAGTSPTALSSAGGGTG